MAVKKYFSYGKKVEFQGVIVLITKDGKTYDEKDVHVPKDVITKFVSMMPSF